MSCSLLLKLTAWKPTTVTSQYLKSYQCWGCLLLNWFHFSFSLCYVLMRFIIWFMLILICFVLLIILFCFFYYLILPGIYFFSVILTYCIFKGCCNNISQAMGFSTMWLGHSFIQGWSLIPQPSKMEGLVTVLTYSICGKCHHVTCEAESKKAYKVHLVLSGHVFWKRLGWNPEKQLAVVERAWT